MDVDEPDADGDTPLILAAMRRDAREVVRLLRAGADPSVRGRFGATALHWVVGSAPRAQAHWIELALHTYRADRFKAIRLRDIRNDDGWTPDDLRRRTGRENPVLRVLRQQKPRRCRECDTVFKSVTTPRSVYCLLCRDGGAVSRVSS